ncbi:threonine aldolase family protein [Paenibacillus glucanolyticus]|uniref:threonine aldolase family protein n=1 Tax=Paenibacillus glucanolyticus TaxID=59843 RepID=UPI00096E70BF|nr:beta-eliminating lyase-related protein [Paenibacillus glucanolyticus]OMF76370.1 low specificity L-threonine aldolase [Paenibacillus glucanolyticus]
MNEQHKSLGEAYNETTYPLIGHSRRNVEVLLEAFQPVDGSQAGDMYGNGAVIEDFQKFMADELGKESAVFFPSGTMAQQIALRIWCDEAELKRVAYHPLCHLEIHEEDGLKELHQIETILLAGEDRLITLEDVQNLNSDIACLLLELPQREIGGQLPDYAELEAISAYCRSQGIKLHLDGARLFEITPYYQRTAAEICSLFDSVYVSFYKGIGGIAGAILAGDNDFLAKSKVWKRRHGGDLVSLYPYIISSEYYYKQRIEKMGRYYDEAKELAAMFNQCHAVVTKPIVPVSNMFHVYFQLGKNQLEPILMDIYNTTGIGFISYLKEASEDHCQSEVNIGERYGKTPREAIQEAFRVLNEKLLEAVQP